MVYTPPTRTALRDSIARDLRDTANAVFTSDDLDDFINFGIAEVNRVYPVEDIEELDITDAEVHVYDTTLEHIWRAEIWRDGDFFFRITPNEAETSRGGWELYAQQFHMPKFANTLNVDTDVIRLWGYRGRAALTGDSDVLEGDLDAEMGIRLYAQVAGYQRLVSDRSLFQQWQTQSNNTDVSPTQLTNMLSLKQGEWEALRHRIRRIRRAA